MTFYGRADYLAEGDWNAECYLCGRKAKASDLVRHWQGFYVCPSHPGINRHLQDFVRGVPDNQAAPWVQSQADGYTMPTYELNAGDSETVAATAGSTTVVNIMPGSGGAGGTATLTITGASGTIIINVFEGMTLDLTDNTTGATVTTRLLGGALADSCESLVLVSALLLSEPGLNLVYGYSDGSIALVPPFLGGSLTPASFNGESIAYVYSQNIEPLAYATVLAFNNDVGATFFSTLQIGAVTLNASDAVYGYSAVGGAFGWAGVALITGADVYAMTIC